MAIGERIRQMRKARSISLRDLAAAAGVSAMAISKYERNMDMPGSDILIRLSQALQTPLEYFLRPGGVAVDVQAYRKHASLRQKDQNAIQAQLQEWVERYFEIEELLDDGRQVNLPQYEISSLDEIEACARDLRQQWNLGLAPIDNLTELLEDQGIKIGMVNEDFDHFDACTFLANDCPVMAVRQGITGDRQRFNLAHELGHLVLSIPEDISEEKAANRFAGAFLVPDCQARFELGAYRSSIGIGELCLLKQKYGLSAQAWVYRAKDLGILTEGNAVHQFQTFRARGWHIQEPCGEYPPEKPGRMERLVFRALEEEIISRSRARELLGNSAEMALA